MLKEKFKIEKDIFSLPISLRQKIYKDIIELSEEADEKIKSGIKYPGVKIEDWPATYIFSEDTIILMISIFKEDLKEVSKVLTLNIPRNEIDKLLEDN